MIFGLGFFWLRCWHWLWFRCRSHISQFWWMVNTSNDNCEYKSRLWWDPTISNISISISEIWWCNNLNSGSLSKSDESFVPSLNDAAFSNNEIERISSNVRVKDLTGGLKFANVVSIDSISFEDGCAIASFLDRDKRDIYAWN